MRISRRPLFFGALAAVCLVLALVTPAEYRVVNYAMAGLALFWFLALGIEELADAREAARRDEPPPGE